MFSLYRRLAFFGLVLLFSTTFTACSFFSKDSGGGGPLSQTTAWQYNNPNNGGFYVPPAGIEQKTAPGLTFVQGGMFVFGDLQEDIMGDWNALPKRITVNSFYMDETEITNVSYKEYLFWLSNVFDDPSYESIQLAARPDSLVWRGELSYNEPLVEYYFHHPSYNEFPVVGVSWKQAQDYCLWRTDRVNEIVLVNLGYISKESITALQGINLEAFNTRSYLLGEINPDVDRFAESKSNPLKMPNGEPRPNVTIDDGILFPEYRLPTEAEWEFAAMANQGNNYDAKPGLAKGRGEELLISGQLYSWKNNKIGIRYKGSNLKLEGAMQANFKRGDGDYMGVAGGLNDNACPTAHVRAYVPNANGLYNMSGNVSEWVSDVYRALSPLDGEDFNYYRGNFYKKIDMKIGKPERDSLGRIVMTPLKDADVKGRRNYKKGDLRNFGDGDEASQVEYGYGTTSLVSDRTRVIKGGSWADMAYWLMPPTRRFLEEDKATSTIGFRCAMSRLGSQSKGEKDGYFFQNEKEQRLGF